MQRGFTLIEISVVITIIGITATMAAPKLVATRERVHVDLAVGRLQAVWHAQRLYQLEHRAYAASLRDLTDADLIDDAFAQHDASFDFAVDGDGRGFLASATRNGTGWSGTLTIDERGVLAGFVRNRGGRRVLP